MNIWGIVVIVLMLMSVILSVMDRGFLNPIYLLVLAIAVMMAMGHVI